ncbi:DHA2 family efflux MFS transporter permease subunit [Shewanella ulleungensis]|jgi:DHA2 family multidrug resistance protein|uniref:EmrB/QacA family drug resistance transporter n=1 Tax=Shewanella ulleungensis TaxID=2282699 RepID=A0ABQ2QT79_9GAMM|nr:DHA2 family efflux MFS transporter permease subunit [Shewanella ulleungensis]MCL1150595.1 DHA2 family efflux MFS transporter permease subunit [Shewanella ulleungensis]GGP92376.1 EmrB/QacA family drug resistance transporter [Shewanella ulleungensis]
MGQSVAVVDVNQVANDKPTGYQRGSYRSWIAVAGGLIGAFMAILDIQITNASMKEIQGSLGATLEEGSWIATAYLVAEMIAIPLSGWLSTGLSTRRYLLWTTAAFIVASILCSMSWNLESMIAFRALQGFFGGALIPLAFRLILEFLPDNKRAMGMALFGVTATFAPSIGPTLGGWLTEQFSWHYLFYINVPPGILVMVMLAYGLERKPIIWDKLKNADYSGIITMALGMGCLEVVLEEGNRKDWFGSELIRNLAIIAVINIGLFIWIQLRKSQPLVNIRLLGQRDFALSTVAYFLLGMALFGAIYLIPLYLSQIHDYTPLEIGEVIMWMGFPQLLVLPLVPKLMQRFDPRYLAAIGFALFSISYYMNSHMTIDYAGDQMITAQIVRALGQPFILVPIGILATMHLHAHENASASTVLNVMRNLGGAFGIALVATLSDNLSRMHLAHIKETLPAVSAQAYQYINDTSLLLQSAGSDSVSAGNQAYALLAKSMTQQAYVQAYNDVFFIMSCLLFIAVIAVLLIRKPAAKSGSEQPNEMH